ncbi:MAG: M48 family metalloprotease [Methanosarcinales archaeon]|jgi:heat shock protein HtpX|nr:M48 family metalloprotease [Methanosarcinales archaeon]MCK4811709.1 M48 family metalloprotease [Methanosarcinales archaeon]
MNILLMLASGLGASVLLIVVACFIFSRQILLRWYRAKKASFDDPLYMQMLKLARDAGMPAAELYFVESPVVNSFSVGNRKNGSIVLTTGAIERLSVEELSCMMVHEIAQSHSRRRLQEIAAVLAGILTMLPVAALWGAVFTGFGQEYEPAPKLIKFYATSLFAPPAALLIQIASPESVKYEADKYAALLCGPDAAIGMLSKVRDQESWDANPSHASLFIANPLAEDEIYNTLFFTRPSIDDRIKRLEEVGY